MISRCRAKCWILQFKEQNGSSGSDATAQRGIKGNIIVYPQKVSSVASFLPPNLDEIAAPICVVFVGSRPPTNEWLRKHAKPLAVRPGRVLKALLWLKTHNHFYKDVNINYNLLHNMPEDYILPVHVEHIQPHTALDSDDGEQMTSNDESSVTFDSVVITDVDGSATSSQMRAAAVRHVENNGGFIQIPHEAQPLNEFFNTAMFPMLYPTLFPYGIGGFENIHRTHRVSLKHQYLQTAYVLFLSVWPQEIVSLLTPQKNSKFLISCVRSML
ncbi:hypothetical protein EV361DRAFT_971848 [Lentinula raphanica]|uniref:DUF6570 domain-containing protein n=1 Tax=Lentinula raphanica TaxID=153919 RepID=A0AA38UGD3_9AGAR|nr:hypothetical protein F5878DRAFT_651200 [Lentinula raphanica]KAJ3970549.1 hypothetical protein EV361DRAFT_971848 [Lentinula raphanica]